MSTHPTLPETQLLNWLPEKEHPPCSKKLPCQLHALFSREPFPAPVVELVPWEASERARESLLQGTGTASLKPLSDSVAGTALAQPRAKKRVDLRESIVVEVWSVVS